MPKLIALVGLPRAGKSTYAKSLGHPIICPDSIRLALHGQRYIDLAEPFVWAIAGVMIRALHKAGHDTVILDATNMTHKRRSQWINKEYETEFHYLPTAQDVCITRAKADNDSEIIDVINRMAGEFEPLTAEDGKFITVEQTR